LAASAAAALVAAVLAVAGSRAPPLIDGLRPW